MALKSFNDLVGQLRRGPSDVVGIELHHAGVRAVRAHRRQDGLEVTAAVVLPAPAPRGTTEDDEVRAPAALNLPGKLRARYACVVIPGRGAITKLLSFPGKFDQAAAERLIDNLGIKSPEDYRIGYKVIAEGRGRGESRVLAVAVPSDGAGVIDQVLPSGIPAPYSLEIDGLAAMTAFLHGPGRNHEEDSVGAMYLEAETVTLALFHRCSPVLLRRFEFGADTILGEVERTLGIDAETAREVVQDGSFDISQCVADVMDSFVKQLVVSRDFVERRENCRVSRLYLLGPKSTSSVVASLVGRAVEIDVHPWAPFDGVNVHPAAVPEDLAGEEWQFTPATGACLGTLEQE